MLLWAGELTFALGNQSKRQRYLKTRYQGLEEVEGQADLKGRA